MEGGQVIAGNACVHVMLEVIVEVGGCEEGTLVPMYERGPRVEAWVEIEQVGHGSVLRDLSQAGNQHV